MKTGAEVVSVFSVNVSFAAVAARVGGSFTGVISTVPVTSVTSTNPPSSVMVSIVKDR